MKRSNRYAVYTRLKSFRQHCFRLGLDLLEDDYRFIDKMLNKIDKTNFKTVLEHYIQEWCIGMGEAQNYSLEQGYGRRKANIWLMEYTSEAEAKKSVPTPAQIDTQ